MPEYSEVTPEVRAEIESIVGAENVSSTPEDIEKHAVDESPLEPHPPHLVVKPISTLEVQQIMKLANRQMIPVTPQGSRTGLSGASHPIYGGIALSLERMNRIIEIDEDNLMATVEPGVLISEVHEATERFSHFRNRDAQQRVARFRRSHQVADWADTTSSRCQRGHFPIRAPLAKFLEASELREVELRIFHLTVVAQLDRDPAVPFDAGHRVDSDCFVRHGSVPRFTWASGSAVRSRTESVSWGQVSGPRSIRSTRARSRPPGAGSLGHTCQR